MSELDYGSSPQAPEEIGYLEELAFDLRNTWEHGTDDIWRRLDPEVWTATHNPRVVLQTVAHTRLRAALAEPEFLEQLTRVVLERRRLAQAPTWFKRTYPQAPLSCVAYFSMEFGLSEALPIYSGGLGNVAGDQLKAAHDLGVPVVGVGLLYQQGYFRQYIDPDGNQTALFPYNDPGQLPITPVRNADGEWIRLKVRVAGPTLWLRAWQARVGRVKLYLLDSNDPANPPVYRGVTSELYGGGQEVRLQQELVLGLGGWRLLSAVGLKPEVCHLNEGHAAFAVLERAREFMVEHDQPFDVALAATRAGNLFTTHTPVPAGFDRFDPALVERYLKPYAEDLLKIRIHDLLVLGRQNPEDEREPFNMAYLAIRGSGAVNAVSALHGQVSRRIFALLFSGWPVSEIPIGHLTNGVHTPTWDSAAADRLWTEACGADRWRGTMEGVGERVAGLPAAELWAMRTKNREELVAHVRERLARQAGADSNSEWVNQAFRPEYPDHRVRAAFRGLQAAQSAAARCRASGPDPHRPTTPGAARRGWQGPSGGRARQGAGEGLDSIRRASRLASSGGLFERLRPSARGIPGPRRRSLDQHSAPAVGSVWDERHESVGERRTESLRTRRMVGGGLCAGGRLGDRRRPRARG